MTNLQPQNRLFLFKYGGNAMTNESLQKQVLQSIISLKAKGNRVVIVHGGGPFIQEALDTAGIESEFIGGHRKTSKEALQHVEMALKGRVNAKLITLLNAMGERAIGLSGKDGQTVIAGKRFHTLVENGRQNKVDLGQVGDVEEINPQLINLLLDHGFLPVLTCIASDREGNDFNINADMFAGNLAGALNADEYIVLTDVDGLMEDPKKPQTLFRSLEVKRIEELKERGIIQGGMIPKMDSCEVALRTGAKAARIVNGTKPETILELNQNEAIGTIIQATQA